MASSLKIKSDISTTPSAGSVAASILQGLNTTIFVDKVATSEIDLEVDTPVVVDLCGLAEAHVVILNASRHVVARVTSADGTTQSVPVDPILLLISETNPVTALDLTREAGNATAVSVFMAEI